jgi:hypothetical protein
MKKFFPTYHEALKYQERIQKISSLTISIWDLKELHPRRIKTRFLVGTYFDWLEL